MLCKIFCFILLISLAFSNQPTVVVIGAGLAGLTTAHRLQQKGINVQVYEARNRVGGRVLSAKIENHIGELGGQNIADGGDAKTMHRLIDELGLELSQNRIHPSYFYFNGKELIPYPPLKIDLTQPIPLSQESKNMRDVLDLLFQRDDPIYRILSVRLAAFEGASIEKLSSLYIHTLHYMLLGGLCSVHQNSIDFVSIQEGNALLPEKLAQHCKVHLNMQLTAVSKTTNGAYSLTFLNGQKVLADVLVLAIPCSVYEDIIFDENVIPKKLLAHIQQIQYGTNGKILFPFPQSHLEPKALINDRAIGFFDAGIFTLYYTGAAGHFSPETILTTYSQDRPMLLAEFKEPSPFLASPAFARDEQFMSYEGAVGYSWPNDPYVKGSYSYISPGQETLLTSLSQEKGEWVKTLFAPIDQTLYFAGEHATILLEVPGTMEAACESGERTARMIENSLSAFSLH